MRRVLRLRKITLHLIYIQGIFSGYEKCEWLQRNAVAKDILPEFYFYTKTSKKTIAICFLQFPYNCLFRQ